MEGLFDLRAYERGSMPVKRIAECGRCGLAQTCISPKMQPSGEGRTKILFIGDFPSTEDDRQGAHLQGEDGDFLREILNRLGSPLEDSWYTNAVLCRPKNGKFVTAFASCCQPTITKTIEELKPKVIVTLGKLALESVLSGVWKKDIGALERWVGWSIPLEKRNAWLCPTYHPGDMLKQKDDPIWRLIYSSQLKNALKRRRERLNVVPLEELEHQVEIIHDSKEAKLLLEDLAKKKGILAFDYETTGLKPDSDLQRIVSCSFCHEGNLTFAFKMKESLKESLAKVLRNPKLKKVASNLKFEERWTRAKLGYSVAGWVWDTMLAAHCLDNRSGITSIKFQAFVLLGIADYASHIEPYLKTKYSNELNRIEELDEDELLLYNGLDSLLEYKVMEKQREEFEKGEEIE